MLTTTRVTSRSPSSSRASKPAQKHVSEISKLKEDAKKDSACPELLQQAAASSCYKPNYITN